MIEPRIHLSQAAKLSPKVDPPLPFNARAIGLYFIYKENPDVLQKHPKFQRAFEALMTPVFQAAESGMLEAVYRKYNPNVEWDFVN